MQQPPPPQDDDLNPMPRAIQRHYQAIGLQIARNQIDQLRDHAKTWAGTISALAGVSSVITALSARDALIKLPILWQIIDVLLLIIALAFIVLAVERAVRAQIGNLAPITSDPRAIQDYLASEPQSIRNAIIDSQRATLIALGAFVAAILIVWAVSTPAKPQTFLYPRSAPDGIVCGVLVVDTATGRVSLKATGAIPAIVVMDAAKLTKVDACP